MAGIQGIVFDLGGVLFTEGKTVAVERLFQEKEYNKNLVLSVLRSEQSITLRKGLMTDDDFWTWAQRQLPSHYDAQTIRRVWYESYLLDKDVFALVKELHKKYNLMILSGNIQSRVDYLEQKYHYQQYFHSALYSFEAHATKPETKFLDTFFSKTRISPPQLLFIDDDARFLEVVKLRGAQGIRYTQGMFQELLAALSSHGIML